jgi:hypothetical protein
MTRTETDLSLGKMGYILSSDYLGSVYRNGPKEANILSLLCEIQHLQFQSRKVKVKIGSRA